MKTPNPQTVAAIVSEINAGMDERGDLTAHPFYDCMRDLLHMKEFRDFLGAFSMISFGDGYATEEDITVFGFSAVGFMVFIVSSVVAYLFVKVEAR